MTTNYGLLPYGTDDPSIVFRRSLKIAPATAPNDDGDVGTCASLSITGASHTFDQFLGFTPNGSHITIDEVPFWADLDGACQIYFEIDRRMLGRSGLDYCSAGFAFTTNQNIFNYYPDGWSTSNQRGFFGVAGTSQADRYMSGFFGWTSDVSGISRSAGFNDAVSGPFVPVIIVHDGVDFDIYVDGIKMMEGTRSAVPSGFVRNILLGKSQLGTGSGYNMTEGSIRNFQVSTAVPVWKTSEMYRKICNYGDSYAQSPMAVQTPVWNMETSLGLVAALNAAGYSIEYTGVHTYSGATIQKVSGAAGNNLGNTTYRAAIAATAPSAVVIQSGANDLTSAAALQFTTFADDLKDHIEFLMGVGAYYPRTQCKGIVVGTTPYANEYTSDIVAPLRLPDYEYEREVVLSIPAWWNRTYPQYSGQVVVADVWERFNGAVVNRSYWATGDKLHPSVLGKYQFSRAWAEALLQLPH